MTFIQEIVGPVSNKPTASDQYQYDNSVHDNLTALQYVMNPSVINDANFSSGGVLKTQSDGDGATFFTGWQVQGSVVATYTLTPENYASDSTIQSSSDTYSGVVISDYTTTGLYFYQRQTNTVRKYQKNYFTFGMLINNNQSKAIKVFASIYSFYNPSSLEVKSGSILLQPGLNRISTKPLLTQSLSDISVGASPYTEFRFNFLDLVDGTADLNIYQIKCEFGTASTLLQQ